MSRRRWHRLASSSSVEWCVRSVVGVNLGNLGYLSEVEGDGLPDALDRFSMGSDAGRWTAENRMMLSVEAESSSGEDLGSWSVLNEAVVEKRQSGNTVRLTLLIDGNVHVVCGRRPHRQHTNRLHGVFTLGERAGSFASRHRALLVTPVAPHMLFDRSLVLDPSEVAEIRVSGHRSAALVVDGVTVADLDDGARVTCRPSEHTATFVRFGEQQYHQILKAKFGLLDR